MFTQHAASETGEEGDPMEVMGKDQDPGGILSGQGIHARRH